MVEPLKNDDIYRINKELQIWDKDLPNEDVVEVSRIKELLKDVLNFAVITNDKIELQCKIINTFGVLFDNGNEDRGMRNDEEISCDTRNTNAGLKSLTKDGLVQPMTSRPDVHEASSQDSPAVPTQSPKSRDLELEDKDKPLQIKNESCTSLDSVGVSSPKKSKAFGNVRFASRGGRNFQ